MANPFDDPEFGMDDELRRRPRNPFEDPEFGRDATFGESLVDTAVAGTRGALIGTKALADVAGANNRVSRGLDTAAEFVGGFESAPRRAEREARQRKIEEAERSGSTLNEIGAYLGAFGEAPLDTTVEAIGTSLPTIGAALATRGRSLGTPAAIGAAQGAGITKGAIYDAVERAYLDGGASAEEAAQHARQAQAYNGKNYEQILIGAGLGAAAGSTGIEPAIGRMLGNRAGQGILRSTARGALKEAPLEGLQGGQERFAGNLAQAREGFDTPLMEGVLGSAALEGVAGGAAGGGFGAAEGFGNRGRTAPDDTDADEPLRQQQPPTPPSDDGGVGPQFMADNPGALASGPILAPEPVPEPYRREIAGRGTRTPRLLPSQQMGLDPAAGPLTTAAATAVDTGLSQTIAAAAEQAEVEREISAPVDLVEGELVDHATGEVIASPELRRDRLLKRLEFLRQQARTNGWSPQLTKQRAAIEGALQDVAGETWTAMSREEREAVVAATDIKGVLRKNLPSKSNWAKLNATVRAKLTAAIDTPAGEIADIIPEPATQPPQEVANVLQTPERSQQIDEDARSIEEEAQPAAEPAAQSEDAGPAALPNFATPAEITGVTGITGEPEAATVQASESEASPEDATKVPEDAKQNVGTFEDSGTFDIAAITRKQIPDMTDDELALAIEHYGPDHKRTAKLRKEQSKRGSPAPASVQQIRAGAVGMKLAPGEVVTTLSGRETTPFPKVDLDSERKAGNTIKRVDRWLMQNALDEAEARGDQFNALQFRGNLDRPSPADKDSAEMYLFEQQPEVIPSILRPAPAPAAEPAPEPVVKDSLTTESAPAAKPAEYGSTNKLVSKDRAEELRKRLKAKLNEIRSGIDPELLAIGTELAVFHIEAGTRRFVDLARVMADDLGTSLGKVRPYLRSWYNGARDMMEDAGIDVSDMDTPDQVREQLATLTDEALANEQAEPDERTEIPEPSPETLGGVATEPSETAEAGGPAGSEPSDSGQERGSESAGADGAGLPAARGRGSRATRVRAPRTGTRGRRGRPAEDVTPAPAPIEDDPRVDVEGEPTGAPNIPAANFQITDDTQLGRGGEVAKFNNNIAAIRTLKQLEAERRRATPEEQQILARYVGWGGLANAFPDPTSGKFKDKWEARGTELRELLTDEEYTAARRSTRNAHYTAENVVSAMWRAVERLGFAGGLVLEPSMGTGNFLGLAPASLPARFVGVEYDSLTARMAQALYPQATVLHSGFQKLPIPENAFALAIGNPPFGSESLRFQFKPELAGLSIHNQFFLASLDALRPGGLQAMVVSRYLMDAKDRTARIALAKKAKLVGLIRLPDNAFKENARTEVVTDIVILQKLTEYEQDHMTRVMEMLVNPPKKPSEEDKALVYDVPDWVRTEEIPDPLGGEPMTVNAHFVRNPQDIMGVMERSGSMQRGADITVRLDNIADLDGLLQKAVNRLPKNIHSLSREVMENTEARFAGMSQSLRIALNNEEVGHVKTSRDGKLLRVIERETEEGGFEFREQEITAKSPWSEKLSMDGQGRWYQLVEVLDDKGKKVKILKDGKATRYNLYERKIYEKESDIPDGLRLGKTNFERLQGLVKLRDLVKRQLQLETADAAKAVMEGNRKALAAAYDEFTKKHGPVNRSTNLGLAMTMPDGGLIAALETTYEPERTKAQAEKSGLEVQKEKATPAPIMRERVVPKYEPRTKADSPADALLINLAETGRVNMERIAGLLGVDPETAAAQLQQGDKPLVFFDPETQQWETADAYLSGSVKRKLKAAQEAGLALNAQALEKVIPEDWGAENVSVQLGGTWVPPSVYADFVKHLMGGDPTVQFSPLTNSFSVNAKNADRVKADAWSSEGAPAAYIVNRLLNSQSVVVTYTDRDGKTHIDQEKTALAGLKAREIANEFGDWIFRDGDRRELLVQIFNELFNTRVVRQFDGQHLTLPGKVPDAIIKMRRHQLNAIWRGIYERFMLVDHAVGAGKTFTAIARAMERRRMGLSRKPMIVVPNHLVEQWAADVYRLYPGAKVLAAGKNDFKRSRRRRLFGKIATGDWDIVIVPHSSFGFIGIAPETEARFLEKDMAEAVAAIEDAWEQAREDGNDTGRSKPLGVKEAERLAEKIQQRMDDLASGVRDRLLTFEQLGVDDLTVDEAHEFKNLAYSSRLTGVRGMGNKTGSRKANDLYNKVRVLRDHPTATVTFLTGTPISNSAVEMFTMLRYLAADELEQMGLTHFDAFRAQFVEATPAFEPTESGRLKEVTRLGRTWSNMRSLMDLYYQVTDAVSLDDIKEWYAKDTGKSFPVPKVKGGKDRQLVTIQPTAAQEEALTEIMAGFDSLDGIQDPYERNAERLRLGDRARKVSLDIRAVNPRSPSTEKGGKLEVVSQNIKRIYDQWSADRGTQLVFLDRSVPKSKGDDAILKEYDALVAKRDKALADGDNDAFEDTVEKLDKYDSNEIAELRAAQTSTWNAYQQIKDNLVAMGIPANEIRFVQEANNDEQKAALFDAVNGGKVRVLIGSTPRMGAGTNVQQRAVALHHVDVTWKPSDIEQREGRVIRQGNLLLEKYGPDFEVEIIAYATERTVDAKMWDLNATKLRTINGIRKYDGAFSMEFEDEEAVGMAEMAALASGNPLLLERVKLESEIGRLELQERAHQRKMWAVQDQLKSYERIIERNPGRIEQEGEKIRVAREALERVKRDKAARTVTIEGTAYADMADAYRAAEDAQKSQQAGDEKARYSITINGERVTTKEGINEAIGAALGDKTPYEAVIAGTTTYQNTVAARLIADILNRTALNKDGDGTAELGQFFGFRLTADITETKDSKFATLSIQDDAGRTIASEDTGQTIAGGTLVSANIRPALGRMAGRLEAAAEGFEQSRLQRELKTAQANIEDVRSRQGQTFPKADELSAVRNRLKEVVTALESGKGGAAIDAGPVFSDGELGASEPEAVYAVTESSTERTRVTEETPDYAARPYETDLFGNALPEAPRARGRRQRNLQPAPRVPGDTDAPAGDYYVKTIVGVVQQRELATNRIKSLADLAQATQYLYRSAVERLDAVVTDAKGKPLAVVGGFKGTIDGASVYPFTIIGEAVRVPGAAHIWFSHNHPSGISTLSDADRTIYGRLQRALKGSGIEPMGLIAIGKGYWSGTDYEAGEVAPPSKSTAVPVIERELVPSTQNMPSITNADSATRIGAEYYKQSNSPGIIFLNSQHEVAAWMPIPDAMRGALRNTGQLRAIYRAISESNAAAAVIVHRGELDAVSESNLDRRAAYQNIAGALQLAEVRALDVVDLNKQRTLAETGERIGADVVYSRTVLETQGEAITADNLADAVTARIPKLGAAIPQMLEKGRAGRRGGVVVINSADPAQIAGVYAKKTGRKFDDSLQLFSDQGRIQGFYDAQSGLTFLIGPHLTDTNAAGVLLHEIYHSAQRERLDAQAAAMIDGRERVRNPQLRALLDRVAARMADSGETGNQREAAAYLIEQAVNEGRTEGYSAVDSRFIGWVERTFGKRLADLVAGFSKMVRQWLLRNGLPITLTVGDLVDYAMGSVNQSVNQNAGTVEFSRASDIANEAVQKVTDLGQAIRNANVQDVKAYAKGKRIDWMGVGLQLLGRRQLVDIYGGKFLPLEQYDRLSDRMQSLQNEVAARADDTVKEWSKIKDQKPLADLMHDATLEGIDADPTTDFDTVDWTEEGRKALYERFNALSPEAQAMYRKVRDMYRDHHQKVLKAMKDRVLRAELSSERKAELLRRMDAEFYRSVPGVYFPLQRFGQYVVAVHDAEGAIASVQRAETMPEANALRRSLLNDFPAEKGFTVGKVTLDKDFAPGRDAVGRGFIGSLFDAVDEMALDTRQKAELEDTIGQLYLSSFPDNSWAKHGIHRKGTPGFSDDARRAFAQNMFQGGRYLSKLMYADQMQAELERVQTHADERKNEADFDQPKAQRVIDEMVKRHENFMNPKTNPVSSWMTSVGFAYFLGFSPATALVNLSQTPLVAYPIMGAKWGWDKAGKELLRASREAMANKNDISAALNEEEKAAFDQAVDDGTIDMTQSMDLAQIAQGEDDRVSAALRPIMRKAAWMFHQAEVFNRQVTFVAAYRLAREKSSAQVAFEQARKATYDGHFDYGAANRPRIAQGNWAKVIFLFKQYGQNMIYTLTRNAYLSLKGEDVDTRKEAQRALGGILFMHFLAAGALGLPMVDALVWSTTVLAGLLGDDDEPWDAEVALRNGAADWLSAALGSEAAGRRAAEVLFRGVSRLGPADISGRTTLDDLVLPDLREGLDGARLGEKMIASMAGPVASMLIVNPLVALQHLNNGDLRQAWEALLPNAAANAVKAYRYQQEGAVDRSRVPIKEEVSWSGIGAQALGFSPSEVRRAFEGRQAIMGEDRALSGRRSELLRKFALASMDKDTDGIAKARKEIREWNKKNPSRIIKATHLMQSVKARQRRIDQSEQGVYLPKNRREALEAGRFADY